MTLITKKVELALEALEKELIAWDPPLRHVQESHDLCGPAITSLRQAIDAAEQLPEAEKQEPVVIDGNTSDGYHTFNELYEFRKAYNAALFNEWAASGKCSVHKSWRHHDGELCFGGGWFIVVAVLPYGQISNHYEAKDWNLFVVPETECALFEFDGHTSEDVIARLKLYTHPQPKREPLTDEVLVPLKILEAAESSLGAFCSDEGWGDEDMQNMDNLSAYIAQHKAAHGIKGEA